MAVPDLLGAPILVVDDTNMIRVMLTRLLKQSGFANVFEAKDGYRRVGLGGGLEGWVRETDILAVRVAPVAKADSTPGGE